MNICVYGASSNTIDKKYIDKIELLGETLAKRGHGLVFGGGKNGAMGASARGALRGGAKKVLGIAPKFFDVDGVLFENCTELVYTDTMRERKKLLEDYSDAFIIAPGGIGTFDEFFEILTLKQLGRHNKPMVLLNLFGYYDPLIKLMENAEKENCLNKATLDLYFVTDDLEKAFDYIENYNEYKHYCGHKQSRSAKRNIKQTRKTVIHAGIRVGAEIKFFDNRHTKSHNKHAESGKHYSEKKFVFCGCCPYKQNEFLFHQSLPQIYYVYYTTKLCNLPQQNQNL